MIKRRGPLGLAGGCVWLAVALAACTPTDEARQPRSTLVIGVDVSGSFRSTGNYNDAIDFAAQYLYGHLNGLGDLRVPTAVFVGSVGGARPGEYKSFQPIHAYQGKSADEMAAALKEQFPPEDAFTDFNAFFERVGVLVKRQGLILAPLEIVILSDGIPDQAGGSGNGDSRYANIDLGPLEYLSRRVTVRLLYASPTVSVAWERDVDRNRVRMWTVDAEVMNGWREQMLPNAPPEGQEPLWKWMEDNVDFRVRSRVL